MSTDKEEVEESIEMKESTELKDVNGSAKKKTRRRRTTTTEEVAEDSKSLVVAESGFHVASRDDQTGGASDSVRSEGEFDDDDELKKEINDFVTHQREANSKRASAWTRSKEKLYFLLSVADVVLLAIGSFDAAFHWFMPFLYVVKFPILMVHRFVTYYRQKFHLFMLDFCYSANVALIVFLIGFGNNPWFSMILFALANGPLAFAVATFRNSLVFHSPDKMTSLVIHVSPPLLTYVIRWHPEETAAHWLSSFSPCLPERMTDSVCDEMRFDLYATEFLYLSILPLCCFIGHSMIYGFLVQLTPCFSTCRRDPRYLTSFRYMARNKGGLVNKLIGLCGRRMRPILYALWNYLYTALTLILTPLLFNSQIAHIIFLSIIVTLACWNGAGYYAMLWNAFADGKRKTGGSKTNRSKK